MSHERRVVWAHGLRRLRVAKALQRDRKAVATITEALRDPDAVDMVGEYCCVHTSWGELGDGKLLDMLGKIGEWFLEHGDEILALLLKLIALKTEEDEALAALAASPPDVVPGGVGVAVLAAFLGLFGLLWAASPSLGAEVVQHVSIQPGESVFEFVSPAGDNVCVGPHCRRGPVAATAAVVAGAVQTVRAVSSPSYGSSGSAYGQPSYGSSGSAYGQRSYGSSGSAHSRPSYGSSGSDYSRPWRARFWR